MLLPLNYQALSDAELKELAGYAVADLVGTQRELLVRSCRELVGALGWALVLGNTGPLDRAVRLVEVARSRMFGGQS